MSDKLIFTTSQACGGRIAAYVKDTTLYEVHFLEEKQVSLRENIYVGKVASVSKNLQAAFIEIKKGQNCYYPLDELSTAIFTLKQGKKPISPGDELLVQVVREAVKTKAPVVSTKLSMAGRYCVATTAFSRIRFSARLEDAEKQLLMKALSEKNQERPEDSDGAEAFGMLVRTNGRFARPDEIVEEYKTLQEKLKTIIEGAKYRSSFSLLYTPSEESFPILNNYPADLLQEIVTDDPEEYERLQCATHIPLRLYKDTTYPLSKLYNLDKQVQDSLQPHVWLKSGGCLVIQPTEALVSIDVNTGKYETGKNRRETFFKINMEAAGEIARQLRLRRLSGIIIIDFINMSDREQEKALIRKLETLFKEDPAHPVVADMTKLGLVEVTRRKNEKSLFEYLKMCGII